MRLLALLSTVSIVATAAAPVASAKIWPYDFVDHMDIYQNLNQADPAMTLPVMEEDIVAPLVDTPTDVETTEQMMVPELPSEGGLTRAQFAEAIATRLYTADAHAACFQDLAGSMNFELLFKDVPVDASYASSVCLMMHNGLMRGSKDMLFHPSARVTAAEAAAVFTRLALLPREERRNEAWYERYMEAMRSIDPEFTLRAWDSYTAKNLGHTLCIFGEFLPAIDPASEFVGQC
jgi:hypothetical protein